MIKRDHRERKRAEKWLALAAPPWGWWLAGFSSVLLCLVVNNTMCQMEQGYLPHADKTRPRLTSLSTRHFSHKELAHPQAGARQPPLAGHELEPCLCHQPWQLRSHKKVLRPVIRGDVTRHCLFRIGLPLLQYWLDSGIALLNHLPLISRYPPQNCRVVSMVTRREQPTTATSVSTCTIPSWSLTATPTN